MSTLPSRLKSARATPRPCWWGSSTPWGKGGDPQVSAFAGPRNTHLAGAPQRATRGGDPCCPCPPGSRWGDTAADSESSHWAGRWDSHLAAEGARNSSSNIVCSASTLFLLSSGVAWGAGRVVKALEDGSAPQPPPHRRWGALS